MTAQGPDHAEFDELAAGYVLDALDPADEERFARHAEGCPHCAQALAGFRQVAAALAEIALADAALTDAALADAAAPAEPSPRLATRILAAVAETGPRGQPVTETGPRDQPVTETGPRDEPAAETGPQDEPAAEASLRDRPAAGTEGGAAHPPAVPLRGRPRRREGARRWQRPAAAAAAAALIAGGGIWAGLAATAGRPAAGPLASCARPHACAEVTLTAATTHRPTAKVVVQRGVAWMEPTTMAANAADEIYVLWQIAAGQAPVAVGGFSVRPGASGPIRIGGLALPYARTKAFAVSLEHGRTIPPAPSKVVAVGAIGTG